MSLRAQQMTKWVCCLLALHAGPIWSPARAVTVRTPPKTPGIVEAQAKFFQDFFSVQLSPYKIEFGHVCEDPNTWEQRYEKKDFKNHRAMGKVRWGDKQGGYGEHYWDLNHAGHGGNHGDDDRYGGDSDDGSYSVRDHPEDTYDEPSEQQPSYDTDEFNLDKKPFEDSSRSKRAHPRLKADTKDYKDEYNDGDYRKPQKNRKIKEPIVAASHNIGQDDDEVENYDSYKKKPKSQHKSKDYDDDDQSYHDKTYHRDQNRPKQNYDEEYPREQNRPKQNYDEEYPKEQNRPKHNYEEETKKDHSRPKQNYEEDEQRDRQRDEVYPQRETKKKVKNTYDTEEIRQETTENPALYSKRPDYVPYEGGAGVRQHQPPEVTPAASVPRLFLEPTTGHVVDRNTGQAYILQPILPKTNNYK